MLARGEVSLHTAHLPVPKTLTSKSRVSTSSKLIENKGLQLHYFGHLRKTGGRGVLLACPERSRRVIPIRRTSKPFVSPTYAKTRGYAPVENVGAPTFLIFPHIFRTFWTQPAVASAKAGPPFRRRKCDHCALNSIQWRITGCRCLQKPSLEDDRDE
jgi:hypothetical protein